MKHSLQISLTLAAVGSLFAGFLLASAGRPALAATNVAALLATAEHNTNRVTTLVHHDKRSITARNINISFTATGQEDETHNREQDHESVNALVKAPTGKTQKIHYVADIIFLNGKTYYRIVPGSPKWKTQKGMRFNDPYTGGWKRGRTTVTFPKSVKFRNVGIENGKTHLSAQASTKTFTGSVDLWISGGSKPYVVREVEAGTSKSATQSLTTRTEINFGPFNKSLVILPPTSAGA